MADYSDIALAAGQTDYITRLNTLIDRTEAIATEVLDGFTGNLDANGYTIANLADPTADQEAATKAYVNAVVVGGGSPGDIPATSLGKGSLGALELLQRNAGNDGWQGLAFPAQTGNADRFLSTNGTALSWKPLMGKLFFFSGF